MQHQIDVVGGVLRRLITFNTFKNLSLGLLLQIRQISRWQISDQSGIKIDTFYL